MTTIHGIAAADTTQYEGAKTRKAEEENIVLFNYGEENDPSKTPKTEDETSLAADLYVGAMKCVLGVPIAGIGLVRILYGAVKGAIMPGQTAEGEMQKQIEIVGEAFRKLDN